jgi:hypothetical protein
MCNEHTGPAFLALGGLAVARSVRRGDGARPWMLAGLAGLLAGYVLLLVAPGNDLRYDGLARQAGILERIGDRGALEDLWLVTRLAVYAAWALPWLLLGVAARRIAPAPPGEAAGREQRLAWIALAAAGELAALALLASPKLGPRLYFASVALVAIALAGWLLPRLATARLKLAGALVSGAVLAYVEVICAVTYARVGPVGAERAARILGSPPGAQVTVPRLPAARGKWFIGDDFLEESQRRSTATRCGLGRIDLAPGP